MGKEEIKLMAKKPPIKFYGVFVHFSQTSQF